MTSQPALLESPSFPLLRLWPLLDALALLLGGYVFTQGGPPTTTPALLGLLLGFIGLNLLLGAGLSFQRTRAWLRTALEASGEVIAYASRTSVDTFDRDNRRTYRVYYPRIRFQTGTGQWVTFLSSVGSSKPQGPVGHRVGVRYHATDSDDATAQRGIINGVRPDAYWTRSLLQGGMV